jgi:uncharacterized protein YegL
MPQKIIKAKKKVPSRKKYKHFFPFIKGSTTTSVILAVIIIGSVLLVAGPFPHFSGTTNSDPNQLQSLNPKTVTGDANGKKNVLQLKTIDFEQCSETTSVVMQLDTSGSMNCTSSTNPNTGCFPNTHPNSKISDLKKAITTFLSNMDDNSLIGIQAFNSGPTGTDLTKAKQIIVPLSLYKDVKANASQSVNSLQAGGGTPTNSAMQFSYGILQNAVKQYPDRHFVFILVSDGAPSPDNQDPFKNNPNPVTEIKNLGVTIYTIGIGSAFSGNNLMKKIASSPQTAFEAPNSTQLTEIYKQIGGQICQDAE